ncbi:MAG TPA: aldolase/citrate lyase family protein [Acidimicrobiales bacterium]|jgi:4-hydroxy-2-oxoheptanedioate aldolase|nr:aldolase/citrate lyase family protein [Acidimicrobiales bacterium]
MGNPLLDRWNAGTSAIGLWATSRDSLVAEALASVGPDYVCVDLQHGASDLGNLVEMLQAVRSGGSVPVVRVPENSQTMITKALDAGALGIIVPLVESGEEARRAVAACRYPPRGHRSMGPFRASLAAAVEGMTDLEAVACVLMIETRRGLDNVEEIAATEGVDALYVGPADLSLALGLPPGSVDHPTFRAALGTIREAATRSTVVVGIHTYDGDAAAGYVAAGFGMVTAGVDLRILREVGRRHVGAAQAGREGPA